MASDCKVKPAEGNFIEPTQMPVLNQRTETRPCCACQHLLSQGSCGGWGGQAYIRTADNHRRSLPTPPQTKVTMLGKSEIYHWKNLSGPILVHQLLGPRPPTPSLLILAWRGAGGVPTRGRK